jgi:hypothetical protein
MDTHDPAVLELLRTLDRWNGPVSLTTTTMPSGTFNARVSYCYMLDGSIATRSFELDEPLPSDASADRRRDRVLVLLRKACMGASQDGRMLR